MFWKRFKESEPQELTVKGNVVNCPICGFHKFTYRETLMNTPGFAFLGWDWANKTANCYICYDCRYVLWFMPR